jgi:hypothetical protein
VESDAALAAMVQLVIVLVGVILGKRLGGKNGD